MSMLTTLRRKFISAPLFRWYSKALPPMSTTEREALEAGTVWWDAELFSGKPDWSSFLANPQPQLSTEEQVFLDGPVEQLCEMLDDWQITHVLRDLPAPVWDFIKEKRFFGMIIPKQYGGLGFSALAHSAIVMKIATRSLTAAVTVIVPNSLGPAELLLRYGTDEQKNYYLPRLAQGLDIPCFALTGPFSGSDAAAMPDRGVICYGEVDGERVLGMRVSWNKRYITLAPVATVLGLAFRLEDPEHLLGDEEDLGITLALIPTNTSGVNIGRRHYPVKQAFQNGPTSGEDVFIPLDWIIGGRDHVGQGWRMLMDCLAAGRSISLPSTATGGARYCARISGAYARVRKQFKVPIGKFEGIEEALARIAALAYLSDAARQITATAIDQGEQPAVISAIMKFHSTERLRQIANDAMDIHGGKSICEGPSNYLANGHQGVPVMITVEGANILTRSLIIFGQGAIRCHPHLLKEMQAAQNPDKSQGLIDFDQALFAHIGFLLGNFARALRHNLTGARTISTPQVAAETRNYFRQLSRVSTSFALLADMTLMILGGELKRREKLSARFGDILSEMYLLSCVLKRFEDDERPITDLPLVHWCCQNGLYTIQQRFEEILDNFPRPVLAWLLKCVIFPFGRYYKQPSDRLGRQCASILLEPGEARERLTAGIYVNRDADDVTGCLEYALEKVLAAEKVEAKLKQHNFTGGPEQALRSGLISEQELTVMLGAKAAVERVVNVDDFDPEELINGWRTERDAAQTENVYAQAS